MRLRPHHLLCTQSYSGKGYDDAFIKNMDQITALLRSDTPVPIEIVCGTDDLCEHCPNKVEKNICKDNDKVNAYDAKVKEYFHIEEKTYIYQDITREIREKMTPDILEDICGNCGWYPVSACQKTLCRAAR